VQKKGEENCTMISIIIPTKNEAFYIEATLKNLREQILSDNLDIEIIVGNSGDSLLKTRTRRIRRTVYK